MKKTKYTPELLRERRAKVQAELRGSTLQMKGQMHGLLGTGNRSQSTALQTQKRSKLNLFLGSFDKGLAIFEGVRLGIILMRKIRRLRR